MFLSFKINLQDPPLLATAQSAMPLIIFSIINLLSSVKTLMACARNVSLRLKVTPVALFAEKLFFSHQ